MKTANILQDTVFDALDNAVINDINDCVENFAGSGTTIWDCDPKIVTIDLLLHCDALNVLAPNLVRDGDLLTLTNHVAKWQEERLRG
jgi:hypothetical protein